MTQTLWNRVVNEYLDLSKYFGKDSTPGGIQFQFRELKRYAKMQRACADSGGDPQSLGIGTREKGTFWLLFFISLSQVLFHCEREQFGVHFINFAQKSFRLWRMEQQFLPYSIECGF